MIGATRKMCDVIQKVKCGVLSAMLNDRYNVK